MVDHEVEETLREIRERVRAAAPPRPEAPPPAPLATSREGAALHATASPDVTPAAGGPFEALARMEANLATTERAWSRLPPVLSYRRGALARFELAVKRLVKRALHWFTWEQVNFNSAAHHALRDALAALAAHEARLAEARAELADLGRRASEAEARAGAERARAEAERERAAGERARAEAASERRLAELRDELERAHAGHARTQAELRAEHERARAELRAEHERLRAELPALGAGLRDGLRAELGGELRERAAAINEEQRVCFRQLSLAATEAAVAHDRARRLLEARLEEIEKTVTGDG